MKWLGLLLTAVVLADGPPQPQGAPQAQAPDPRTRADVLRELADAERAHARQPGDRAAALAYGKLLFQAGEFWLARDLVAPLAEPPTAPDEALELAARLQYLVGNHEAADRLYQRLVAARAGNPGRQVAAMVGQMFACYQRNQFDRIAQLPFPAGVQLPTVALAKAFTEAPYRLEWRGDGRVSEVPLTALDPLPQFPIEVNGVPLLVIFDTGGDTLILDDEVARALGIPSAATATGTFGGGLQAPVGFGKVDRVTVGGVTLHQVPVAILATKRFTFDKRYPVSGIFGTALMRQFLGTLDYRNQKIVLRERTPAAAAAVRRELAGRLAAEIPFALSGTHMMYARGSLDGKDGLTFFIDSGLAMDALFGAPVQTLQYAGIPVPETRIDERSVGGGGGKFPTGSFAIRSLALGPLRQTDGRGSYGGRPPQSYWGGARGFIEDGLLSHGFLKRYGSWTIDFDSMTYLFER